jgi:hypothetical protein
MALNFYDETVNLHNIFVSKIRRKLVDNNALRAWERMFLTARELSGYTLFK